MVNRICWLVEKKPQPTVSSCSFYKFGNSLSFVSFSFHNSLFIYSFLDFFFFFTDTNFKQEIRWIYKCSSFNFCFGFYFFFCLKVLCIFTSFSVFFFYFLTQPWNKNDCFKGTIEILCMWNKIYVCIKTMCKYTHWKTYFYLIIVLTERKSSTMY